MIRTLAASTPTYSAPRTSAPCPDAGQTKTDPVFDLTTLDNAREVYFLPHVDRVAAHLAASTEKPVHVRLEAENQFIEYTITKDPAAPIEASINGVPFQVSGKPAEDGSLALTGTSAAGDFDGNLYQLDRGTGVSALVGPNRMPINHDLFIADKPSPGDPAWEAFGNFACARMNNAYYQENQDLHVLGNLGIHDLDARLSQPEPNKYVFQGDFGDLKFHQTLTVLDQA